MEAAASLIMGIVNRTPDSFYAESRSVPHGDDPAQALGLVAEGADILDIGGESSRPGSEYVPAEEETRRVVPFIRELRRHVAVPISVDTRKRAVAEAALDAGANMINDISALRDDPDLARLAAERQVPVVLMHMAGTPRTMQLNPHYNDVVAEVERFLLDAAERALAAGIRAADIILDPGIGFGKTLQHNIQLMQALPRLRGHGFRLLLGLSRKTMIGMLVGSPDAPAPVQERLIGSVVANLYGADCGADILRVHDVAATRQALAVLSVLRGREGSP
ncbi:dihydropteroate synthase [Spirochaeta africana]|uniref:dihydropteroate synthase n=1 Tax=Spirochaeta africana (strain ATCC 700263 / DSM 8902 / Z-7692) TaxID=889378 RepID=H9UI16_SPIAZ|nr:dihydropteroate synthase [Spirochaeta africana]AFG37159.1 dihydropteroate synthase [Spirochaeta africana DSM 8902]